MSRSLRRRINVDVTAVAGVSAIDNQVIAFQGDTKAAEKADDCVEINVQYLPGSEPDEFNVAFEGVDGTKRSGTEIELPAGKVGTWALSVKVAKKIQAGGGILFQRRDFVLAFCPQDENPKGRDYVSLQSKTRAKLELIVSTAKFIHQPAVFLVKVVEGSLESGDTVTVLIGDRRHGSPGSKVYVTTTLGRFLAAVDRDGSGNYRDLAGNPIRIHITPDAKPHLLRVLGPSIVAPGEFFDLHVVMFDLYRNICEPYQGGVNFEPLDGIEGLPSSIRFSRSDRGIKIIENLRMTKPGLFSIKAEDESETIGALSNPMICEKDPTHRLFWGDLHCHTYGDTTIFMIEEPHFKLHPSKRHEQARFAGRLDFAAPGPTTPSDQEVDPSIWKECQKAYQENDLPGKYVPFLAYEAHPIHSRAGDRTVIFRDWSDGYLSVWADIQELMEAYSKREDVLLEGHVGGGPPNYEAYRPPEMPLLEIASGHGCFEWVLQDALANGYRPAVIGASDAHISALGHPMGVLMAFGRFFKGEVNYRDAGFGSGPIAAVWAERCERESIWKGLKSRRTFATTGARIILNVKVNGHRIGSEIEAIDFAEIHIEAHGTAPVQRVDLIRNDRCLKSWFPNALDIDLTFRDKNLLQQGVYYIRLRQQDGEYAWSTPIWVYCKKGDESPDDSLPPWNVHEPVDLTSLRPNEAEDYEEALRDHLEQENDLGKFSQLTPITVVNEVPGNAALFYAYLEPDHIPVSIRWYFEFEMPDIHLDWGWRDFGIKMGG